MEIIEDDDCIHDLVWEDDGEYLVRLTITDGESDTDTIEENITILNRPPEIIVDASIIADNNDNNWNRDIKGNHNGNCNNIS